MSYIFDSSVVIENMILKFIKQNNFSIPIKDNQLLIPSSDDRNNFIHRLTRYFRATPHKVHKLEIKHD